MTLVGIRDCDGDDGGELDSAERLKVVIENSINGTGASQYGRFSASAKAIFIVKWAKTDDDVVEMIKDLLHF
jgi:hypothetical protein